MNPCLRPVPELNGASADLALLSAYWAGWVTEQAGEDEDLELLASYKRIMWRSSECTMRTQKPQRWNLKKGF